MSNITPTVFVVDDDVSVHAALGSLIRVAGWRLKTFPSTQDFLEHPRLPTPSCLVLDVALPDLSGLDLQKRVADRTEMPIIFIAGYDIHSYVDVAPLLASAGYGVIVPYLRGYGPTRFLSNETFRNGQQSVVALDVIALMDALKIRKAIIGGFDWGARTAGIMAALWPDRCKAIVSVSGYLITSLEANLQPQPPVAEYGWWYQYYFSTERGRTGYDKYRQDFNKLIWKNVSPKWNFDDATFERTAASFNNADHVAIVIHNYRWRLGLAKGEARYDDLEQKLFKGPVITVPTITIASDFDGPAANGAGYAKKFSGKYSHRILEGIGHNVPQEAPHAFADAILEVDRFAS
jgi:pimeloyl-ACP methyl ester carboxylesterase